MTSWQKRNFWESDNSGHGQLQLYGAVFPETGTFQTIGLELFCFKVKKCRDYARDCHGSEQLVNCPNASEKKNATNH